MRIEDLVRQEDRNKLVGQHLQGKPVVRELVRLLDHRDTDVRVNASSALGSIAKTDASAVIQAIPKLVGLLDDEDADVRELSAESFRSWLDKMKSLRIDISEIESLFVEVQNNENPGKGSEIVFKLKERLPDFIAELKEHIEITLPELSLIQRVWKRIEISLENKGRAPANKVIVSFPPFIKVSGLKEIETIKPSDKKTLRIGIKPEE